MKRFRGRDGTERLWYEPAEIEEIMEGELTKARLFPTLDAPVVDIERFIEGHLQAQLDQYAELHPTVLGVTDFRAGERPLVQINKDLTGSALDEEGSPAFLLGRWRATLAHEGSHIILHRCLFQLNPHQPSLFEDPEEPEPQPVNRLQRCLKRDVTFRGSGNDWREVQANMGMAALLMPKPVFLAAFRKELDQAGWSEVRIERNSLEARVLVTNLAAFFQVSRQAAAIRFETLALLAAPGQADLL
ncbi:MAG: ImmA/IrrE family metallo-endopeptidase [Gemmataceae bacterium]|nr:ImmA/IrrE family metallo-endopeptidase [Gemmataceae bacterium]